MLFHNEENHNSIRILFTRDSVSVGDDCMAPHKEEMLFKATDTWLEEKIENLTYQESLEVLYKGEYFSATCFREYKNAGMILEEEETKITTRDKAFAMKHGFNDISLGNYQKILPIDQFEGMRILRTPSHPHAEVIRIDIPKEKIMEELKKRAKSPHDVITDGVLAYGVDVGRFVYEEEGYTVYVITDFPHIGPSDVFMVYQISKADYEKLIPMSCSGRIPKPPVPSDVTDACRKEFLCGESAYCKRYYCTLDDVDKTLAERIVGVQTASKQKQSKFMNYCPNCGRKNDGNNYCSECGTKLSTL